MTHPLYGATKETTPFHIFKSLVAECAGLAVAALHSERLHRAYEMGEAAWMVADEMKLRAQAPKRSKSPREIAVRIVSF